MTSLIDRIGAALSEAGAFCGECDFQPGETGCPDCVRVREVYADALLAVVQPELDRLAADNQQLTDELATARADGMRQAAAMLRAYCPDHGGLDEAFIGCHCAGADEIDRNAAAQPAPAVPHH